MKTIVIIPAFNEASKIAEVVRGVIARGYEVLVVDDCSRDETAEYAALAGAYVVRHGLNRGYGAALTTGNKWALENEYAYAVHFDADGQHNPNEIEQFIDTLANEQVDVVIGSRFLQKISPPVFRGGVVEQTHSSSGNNNVPILRHILLKLAILFTWIVSGVKLTDAHNGFRALSQKALEAIQCKENGMAYASEIIDQIGKQQLRFKEVPMSIAYTDYSKAKGQNNVRKMLVGLEFLLGKRVK